MDVAHRETGWRVDALKEVDKMREQILVVPGMRTMGLRPEFDDALRKRFNDLQVS